MSSLPVELLRHSGGFLRDPRFSVRPDRPGEEESARPEIDYRAEAYALGYSEGSAQAMESALQAERERDVRRNAIELAFARFDERSAADLQERLRQTVLALCEEAVVPLAIDAEGLAARIEKATSMLQRVQDDRCVLLNPQDLALVAKRLPEGVTAQADPSVERGGLRIETADGGIEDGPSQWRRLLAEAFREC